MPCGLVYRKILTTRQVQAPMMMIGFERKTPDSWSTRVDMRVRSRKK